MSRKHAVIAFAAVLALVAGPFCAQAAEIYLDPATGKYPPGVTFAVAIRLDNQNQCVNAAEVDLSYPKNKLQAVAVSDGDSILSIWVQPPAIYDNYGLVSFVGGLPGGYCGRVAGDPTLSNKLATVYFRFPTSTSAATVAQIANLTFLSSTRAILNDGEGTPAKLVTAGASYSEILNGQYAPLDTWQNALANDTTPPEAFSIGVYQDKSLFNDQWFAAFSTSDKQTGVDHYEVAEVPIMSQGLSESQWNWIRAVSPYLVKDQSLHSMIAVRAVDYAGNIRIEHYLPPQAAPPIKNNTIISFLYLAAIGILFVALLKFL
ncbi:MAG TPA: hypothetical protein VNG29_03175 [Candidatus Paceibacterota bacterium]|nr:hypothetical protein [Candidatus Paceibacterota bacterium]